MAMSLRILCLCLLQALLVHANMPMELFQRSATSAPAACPLVTSAIDSCESVSPGFTDFSPASQAACLCYSSYGTSTAWVPEYFDGAVLTCANWMKTADQTDYSPYQAPESFCTRFGNVLQTPIATTATNTGATATGPITSAATMTGLNVPACTTIVDIIASCIEATPFFENLPNTAQASCACYSGDTWDPNGFDVPAESCANYVKTAVPADYSVASPLVGFCTKYGGQSNSQTPATTPATTSPSKTMIVVYTPAKTSIFQTTVSVKHSAGSSSHEGGFGRLLWALAAVALDMLLLF